jgi:hypothetical protein
MENEIMNHEDEVMDVEVVETEGESGISTGVAIAIGACLTLAATAVVKLVKKGIAAYKEKKTVKKPAEGENIEPTEEQIEDVTE